MAHLKQLLDTINVTYTEKIFESENGIAGLGTEPFVSEKEQKQFDKLEYRKFPKVRPLRVNPLPPFYPPSSYVGNFPTCKRPVDRASSGHAFGLAPLSIVCTHKITIALFTGHRKAICSSLALRNMRVVPCHH